MKKILKDWFKKLAPKKHLKHIKHLRCVEEIS